MNVSGRRKRMIGGVLLVVAALAVVAWLGLENTMYQRDALARIQELGGAAGFDEESYGAYITNGEKPDLNDSLFANLNRDVIWIHLANTPVADADMQYLVGLGSLRILHLPKTKITDEGLMDLRRLKKLEVLYLDRTRISDKGLQVIAELENLNMLHLIGTDVTDDGLVHLRSMENLQWLFLSGTAVSDSGLETLATFPKLEYVELTGTNVTEEGVTALTRSSGIIKVQRSTDPRVINFFK